MSTSEQVRSRASFAAQTRERLRAAILEATTAEVAARGWRGLRMQAVADRVGVIRQTINTEFGDKKGLARALILSYAAVHAAECAQIIERSPDIRSAIHDSVLRGLQQAAENEVFRVIMTPDSSATFLPIYTSEGAPMVEMVTTSGAEAFLRHWPELDHTQVRIAANAMVRFTLSHIVLPLAPIEQTATEAAALFTPYLDAVTRRGEFERP